MKLLTLKSPPDCANNIALFVVGVAGNVTVTAPPEVSMPYLLLSSAVKSAVLISKSSSLFKVTSVLIQAPPLYLKI